MLWREEIGPWPLDVCPSRRSWTVHHETPLHIFADHRLCNGNVRKCVPGKESCSEKVTRFRRTVRSKSQSRVKKSSASVPNFLAAGSFKFIVCYNKTSPTVFCAYASCVVFDSKHRCSQGAILTNN